MSVEKCKLKQRDNTTDLLGKQKSKTLAAPTIGRDEDDGSSHPLLVGMRNDTDTL